MKVRLNQGDYTKMPIKYLLAINDNFMIMFYFIGFFFECYISCHGDLRNHRSCKNKNIKREKEEREPF